MRYDLRTLAKKGGSDTVRFTVEGFDGLMTENAGFEPHFPIDVTARFTDTGADSALLNVSFEAELTAVCDSCLGEYGMTVVSSEDYTVSDTDSETADCVVAINKCVELVPLVWEAICLAVPYKKSCGDNCPGIDYGDSDRK